jgi:hypothetical protein
VLLTSPDAIFLYFRRGNQITEASAGNNGDQWSFDDIEDAVPVHDPRAAQYGDRRLVVYWGDDDDWYLLAWSGSWLRFGGILNRANVRTATGGRATGQPVVYVTQGVEHIVGRVDRAGHLFDAFPDGAGGWKADNVTLLAQEHDVGTPAATYSPCVYETSAGVAIVFRAVGGHIWVITRTGNIPTDATAAANAKPAAGHPTCFVLNGIPRIVYRGTDNLIYGLWFENFNWHAELICTQRVAADPVAATNGTIGLVAVRSRDGMIFAAEFDGAHWTCTPTTTAAPLPPPIPSDFPSDSGGVIV